MFSFFDIPRISEAKGDVKSFLLGSYGGNEILAVIAVIGKGIPVVIADMPALELSATGTKRRCRGWGWSLARGRVRGIRQLGAGRFLGVSLGFEGKMVILLAEFCHAQDNRSPALPVAMIARGHDVMLGPGHKFG